MRSKAAPDRSRQPVSGFGFRKMNPVLWQVSHLSIVRNNRFSGDNDEDFCGLYGCRFDGDLTPGE